MDMETGKRKPSLIGRVSTTIHYEKPQHDDMKKYLQQRLAYTGERMTQQQFIETAIYRELARVRGKNPDEVPDAPNLQKIAQQKRRAKDG